MKTINVIECQQGKRGFSRTRERDGSQVQDLRWRLILPLCRADRLEQHESCRW
jgi:hypothetical protein